MSIQQDFFANNLANEKPLMLIRELLFRKLRWALRQVFENQVGQQFQIMFLQCGDGDDFRELAFLRIERDQGQQFFFLERAVGSNLPTLRQVKVETF